MFSVSNFLIACLMNGILSACFKKIAVETASMRSVNKSSTLFPKVYF